MHIFIITKTKVMSTFFHFTPARLVQGLRWYIEFYQTNPTSKKLERVREYRQMNRIKDIQERQKFASRVINDLNTNLLPFGYPHVQNNLLPNHITLLDAVNKAYLIKCRSDRKKTSQTYGTVVNYFIDYIKKRGRENTVLNEFTFRDAMMFMDHAISEKKMAPQTYNNYRQFLVAIWNELVERAYIIENPWTRVKKQKATDKNRHMLSNADAQMILNEAYNSDKMLFLSILLLHNCFIRPEEQRGLKVNMINLKDGTIYIPGEISKNKRSDTVTIPSAILPYFYEIGIDKLHLNDFIFGKSLKPHPTVKCGSNALNNQHNKLINILFQKKKLRSISGISLYSWKDTGAMALIRGGIDIYEVMRQMRHTDLSTTQKYLKSLTTVNTKIRDLSTILLPIS